eukprot:CAMPEP_0198123650 /NCGR_PEP_ID=MMETSP1442-20131203/38032_1 /TAXON_ID= /ORGANISM="Craspedostauros australis, Strain CCMP3328" /LENGTH=265 /DNA_ID=CAMNT_0043782883 /DNA_START=75 /DNA_END=872 /DNA_ORIENTATION=+
MASDESNQGQDLLVIGPLTDLAALRIESTRNAALSQRNVKVPDDLMVNAMECTATVHMDSEDDDDVDEENKPFDKVPGLLFVTQAQMMFVSDSSSEQDVIVGARCIQLHAMTEDPELAVYLQVGLPDSDDNDEASDGGGEVFVHPNKDDDCDVLFKALCKLISMHPVVEEDGGDGGISGGLASLLMGGMAGGGTGYSDELVWANSEMQGAGENGAVTGGFPDALEGEDLGEDSVARAAMLEKLDGMLVVPPELEVKEGQFEDADE